MEDFFSSQQQDVDVFYKLLGCDESSTTEQINTEFKVRALDIHPDKNPDDPKATERFAVLQRARDILTDQKRRQEYDFWRRSGIAISYDSWIAMKNSAHMSMHWATKKKKDLMLEGDETQSVAPSSNLQDGFIAGNSTQPIPGWTSEPANDVLRKFRNYEI